MGVNSLPKTVALQRRGCDLNLGPSVSESITLTTRLPSHSYYDNLTPIQNHNSSRSNTNGNYTSSVLVIVNSLIWCLL